MKTTTLDDRIMAALEDAEYLELTGNDIYAITKNICMAYGHNPTDEQIREEIDIFYNS